MRRSSLRRLVPPSASGREHRGPPPRSGGGPRPLPVVPTDTVERRAVRQPELQLMAAVLIDAIDTVRKTRRAHDPRSRRRLWETVAWLEDTDVSWPFSFASICAALDLDAARVREMLR